MSDPANAVATDRGRVYVHPVTGEEFLSVTTALKVVGKESLIYWAAGLAGRAALDELPRLIHATRLTDCGRTFARCAHDWRDRCDGCPCQECPACTIKWLRDRHIAESSRRAEEGTRTHRVIERWVLDGTIPAHDADITPYVKAFGQFVADYGLTPADWDMTEATVISREYGYAGTLDQVVRFRSDASPAAANLCARLGKPTVSLLGDNKTREGTGAAIYPEHALQLAAYRNCPTIMLRDGTEHPLPTVDGAFVLQLRPDGYDLRLVVADDRTFGAFLAVLAVAKWQHEYATASVSTRAFPLPKPKPAPSTPPPPAATPPATKRAPRKATKTAKPVVVPALPLQAIAAAQSATLRSLLPKTTLDVQLPDDEIPF